MQTTPDDPLRKAAVLLRSMDSASSSAILARMSAEEAGALRRAMRSLGEVGDDELENAAEAFRGQPVGGTRAEAYGSREDNGVELRLSGWNRTEPGYHPGPATTGSRQPALFHDLADTEPVAIARYLAGEQPQTVAVVLFNLPPGVAAQVLDHLPQSLRLPVLDRLADLDDPDTDNLQVLAEGLKRWIVNHRKSSGLRDERRHLIASILKHTSEEGRRGLAESISRAPRDWWPEEASASADESLEDDVTTTQSEEAVPPAPTNDFRFEELVALTPFELVRVLRESPPAVVVLALVGAEEAFVQKIERQLTRKQVATLRSKIAAIGPTRLRDVEAAQTALGMIASRLAEQRLISRPGRMAA